MLGAEAPRAHCAQLEDGIARNFSLVTMIPAECTDDEAPSVGHRKVVALSPSAARSELQLCLSFLRPLSFCAGAKVSV